MQKYMFAVGLVPLVLFLAMPYWGHGSFGNPIMVTKEPITMDSNKPYTEMIINGEIKYTPMNTPTSINSWDEVEIGPMYSGWGNDFSNGIRHYKMSDEMYNKFCPSWDSIKEMVDSKEILIAGKSGYQYGVHPYGCASALPKVINQTEEPLGDRSLYFNSDFFSDDEITEMTGTETDSQFISTFYATRQVPVLNSPFHNAMVASIAIQCYGGKWWTFSTPRSMAKYGTRAYNGATILRGVDEEEEHWVVYTEPGTIISFPPWWPHFVISDAGNTFLYTLRKVYPNKFMNWLSTNTQLTLEVISRIWYERMSLINTIPPNNGKTAHENSRPFTDVHSDPTCENEITLEDLQRLIDYNDKVLGRK